jgi:hypothetical protein
MEKASYKPSDTELQHLLQVLSMPGYQVLQRIQLAEIDFFQLDLINVDPTKPNYETEVRAKHSIALAAGMFYQRLQEKIAGYVARMKENSEQRDVLPDTTEEVFG